MFGGLLYVLKTITAMFTVIFTVKGFSNRGTGTTIRLGRGGAIDFVSDMGVVIDRGSSASRRLGGGSMCVLESNSGVSVSCGFDFPSGTSVGPNSACAVCIPETFGTCGSYSNGLGGRGKARFKA